MARTFNGTSDQIAFGSEAAIDDLGLFTACAMIRPTATITDERQILTKMNSSYLGKIYLALTNSNEFFCYMNRNGGNDCYANSGDSILTANQWNVIVSTWAGVGSAPLLYHCLIGGTLIDVTSVSQIGSGSFWNDDSATLRVGARDPGDATYYAGGLAECALWNRMLSTGEMDALSRGFAPAFFPAGRVFYSKVDGRSSPELNYAGTTHGTLTGTTYLEHPPIIYPTRMPMSKGTVAASTRVGQLTRGKLLKGGQLLGRGLVA